MSEAPYNDETPSRPKPRKKRRFPLVSLTLLLALLTLIACLSNNYIPSESMEPTLKVGDRVLTARAWVAYLGGRMPARGDIIVFRMPLPPNSPEEEKSPPSSDEGDSGDKGFAAQIRAKLIDRQKKGDLLIKRVIGLPGETIVVKENAVYINGRRLIEDYKTIPSANEFAEFATEEKPLKVPEGDIFVLGDNRATSDDGRYWGTLHRDEIVGKFIRVLYNDGGVGKRVAEGQKSGN